ncbi:velvet factor-domain-containing protein [Blakeslea trispora]|nr:velvet factor-domain-containing protein [Blakeslea trispora]
MSQQRNDTEAPFYKLIVRQQPCKARLCSFKEKVDRRPIDPPPIIQLLSMNQVDDDYLQNPYFFLYATLTDAHGEIDLHFVNGNRTTAGTVVQSLHRLKDFDNTGL